ncbi:uncharacterized protein LOC103508540 [Diaphorina citri]|uniref:Uncharacterized protein LOC103508540 n=1 Tax=Diaphorina citri TaxID=121845 RepID=A0A1S4EAM0_DIACI|nr:uncharacterized protein LOC103508540 [Diaphorina citri]
MQICDESSLKFNNGGIQFINEVLLYNDFLPYFSTVVSDIQDLFPKFVYGYVSTDNRFEDIIILENLSLEKYRLATSRTQLSLEHILMALRGLGKFHACSYIMKSIDKDTFLAKVNAVRDIRNWVTDPKDSFQNFIVKNCERGFKYLAGLEEYKDKLDNVRQFLANPAEWFPRFFEVNDRTSVLCHGDFCRNNMFFKYEDSGRPVNVKFFDMATIIHASPVLDIAFFLYLNTGQDQRVQHWDQMIHSYYDSLKQTCESCHHTVEFPTYEDSPNIAAD